MKNLETKSTTKLGDKCDVQNFKMDLKILSSQCTHPFCEWAGPVTIREYHIHKLH